MRKALAFAGFTHKAPRAVTYLRADYAFGEPTQTVNEDTMGEERGRSTIRGGTHRFRAMSL